MPHYNLESLQAAWSLVRETPYSAIYNGTTTRGIRFIADIHFTAPKILTVSLVVEGSKAELTDGQASEIFEDLEHLALRRGSYEVIDYTLSFTQDPRRGNYSIDPETISSYRGNLDE